MTVRVRSVWVVGARAADRVAVPASRWTPTQARDRRAISTGMPSKHERALDDEAGDDHDRERLLETVRHLLGYDVA